MSELAWIAKELRPLARAVKTLKSDPENARRHPEGNLKDIESSLRAHGQCKPIVVRNGVVIAGNGTLEAAARLGWSHLACVEYDGTDRAAHDFALADNRASDRATYDEQVLAAALREADAAGTLAATGYDDDSFRAVLASADLASEQARQALQEATGSSGGEGAATEPHEREPKKGLEAPALTKAGDVFELGRHRVLCGDSTATADVEKLFGTEKVDQLLTDPPYGVDMAEKWESQNRMTKGRSPGRDDGFENDSSDEVSDYRLFFTSFLRRTPFAERNTAFVFMSCQELHQLRLAFEDAGLHFSDYLIWKKDSLVLGRRDYHAIYEPIAYGWSGRHKFYGPRNGVNVLEYARARRNDWHPCQKPVELCARLIRDGSPEGGLVYDPFLGGGSTLLAAESMNRTCYGIEKDPKRCDIIRLRWDKRSEELKESPL